MSRTEYAGQELELFQSAVHWKAYLHAGLSRSIRGDVLEVGAGIGGTTRFLCDGNQSSWVCLEPDAGLAAELATLVSGMQIARKPEIVNGDLAGLASKRTFDTILYIDVLEHIERDKCELELARDHLRPGGAVIVLAPAFQFLFSEFDRSVGHFRRYNRTSLAAVIPDELRTERMFYLDSVGLLASLANRILLRQGVPTKGQIRFWDRFIVQLSRLTDRLCFQSFGRSIVAVLRRK